jgi:hypothetical protein
MIPHRSHVCLEGEMLPFVIGVVGFSEGIGSHQD